MSKLNQAIQFLDRQWIKYVVECHHSQVPLWGPPALLVGSYLIICGLMAI